MHKIYVLILSIIGLINAIFLYWQFEQFLKKGRKFFCIIGSHCQDVVSSEYGKTFGIKNEIYGILFYTVILILSILQLFFPEIVEFVDILHKIIIFITFVAAAFSTYLLYLQMFVLKKYCSWCIFATVVNYVLFAISLFGIT